MSYTKEDLETDINWLTSFDVPKDEAKNFIKCIIKDCKKENLNYKKAYDILSEYFDSISDEEKPKVHRALKRVGL